MSDGEILDADGNAIISTKELERRHEEARAELRALAVGNQDLLVIKGPKRYMGRAEVALLVQTVRTANPSWAGATLVLQPDQELMKLPEPMARKLYRVFHRMFGAGSDSGAALVEAVEQIAAWPPKRKAKLPVEIRDLLDKAQVWAQGAEAGSSGPALRLASTPAPPEASEAQAAAEEPPEDYPQLQNVVAEEYATPEEAAEATAEAER